ncbi:hypothetical protein [Azospirillum rugosum]|uniref:Uncharacterized protein n=1 Tax=Azospirillum rugosum TaxID=416170 RepID=A0ABS4SV02_9PROT|nr:hypothetical protein [Azospirillum rugosum]MBP2296029.1 hypothetical protein [Azospirillum rugosum]MDQ0529619.1 hypothetical protein [Azospirillum rugosum]
MPAHTPCAPAPVVTHRTWSGPSGSGGGAGRGAAESWTYTIGFDLGGNPVRFDIARPEESAAPGEGPEEGLRPLVQGWRTAGGEWYGLYRCATGCATARLSPLEVESIETAAKMALVAGSPEQHPAEVTPPEPGR